MQFMYSAYSFSLSFACDIPETSSLLATTPKGNYIFWELDAPEPYNCFDKTRFVDTDMTVGNLFEVEFFSEEEDPYYPEELYTTQEA